MSKKHKSTLGDDVEAAVEAVEGKHGERHANLGDLASTAPLEDVVTSAQDAAVPAGERLGLESSVALREPDGSLAGLLKHSISPVEVAIGKAVALVDVLAVSCSAGRTAGLGELRKLQSDIAALAE